MSERAGFYEFTRSNESLPLVRERRPDGTTSEWRGATDCETRLFDNISGLRHKVQQQRVDDWIEFHRIVADMARNQRQDLAEMASNPLKQSECRAKKLLVESLDRIESVCNDRVLYERRIASEATR